MKLLPNIAFLPYADIPGGFSSAIRAVLLGETFSLGDLFTAGEEGFWFSFTGNAAFSDTEGTTLVEVGEGIAALADQSGNGYTGTQGTSTARPIFRADPFRAEYDLADDVVPLNLDLPAISDGVVVLVGVNGIWFEENYTHTGGSWSLGPSTYTNGPAGILDVVGDLLEVIVREGSLTAKQRAGIITKGKNRGAAGVFTLGTDLIVNGDFAAGDLTGWTGTGNSLFSYGGGRAIADNSDASKRLVQTDPTIEVGTYLVQWAQFAGASSGAANWTRLGVWTTSQYVYGPYINGAGEYSQFLDMAHSGRFMIFNYEQGIEYDNISVRKLELII